MGLKPRTALIVAGGALAAGIAFFWWRNRQSSQASQSATSSSTGCTDSQGNSVPCPDSTGVDYSGELSVIQTELETLLSEEGGTTAGGGTGTTTATVTVPKVTGLTATAAVAALKAVGLVAGSEGKNGGTQIVNSQTPGAGAKVAAGSTVDLGVAQGQLNGTPPPPAAGQVPGTPSGLKPSGVTAGGFTVSWGKVTGATSYRFDVTYQGKVIHSGTTASTRATLSGLTRDHTYTFHVQACGRPGCGGKAQLAVKTSG
jgi:hypothetical protein